MVTPTEKTTICIASWWMKKIMYEELFNHLFNVEIINHWQIIYNIGHTQNNYKLFYHAFRSGTPF